MPRVLDWHINATWTGCAVSTGAVWYFASTRDWTIVVLTLFAALLCALFAVYLHRQKDAQVERAQIEKAELDQKTLSINPTKDNIERVILESDPIADWIGHASSEKSAYSYAHDVNLRFEVLNDDRGIQCEDFMEPWANKFPDRRAIGYWCNLFYGSTQIDRYILVAVDGARALLPTPRFDSADSSKQQVRPIDYKVAQIYDITKTLDQYMQSAGLHVSNAVSDLRRTCSQFAS